MNIVTMETRSLAEKGVGAKTRCHKFIMINTSARRATRGRDATRRCIYLSLCARMTESDEIPKRDGRETRVYDFRTNRSPGGCCARVRINLRLLVKIRALSFHLCVRARASSFARLAASSMHARAASWLY